MNRKQRMQSMLLMSALSLISTSHAQFNDSAEASQKPWAEFKLSSKKTVKFDFRNSNVEMVIRFFSTTTGITIVKDPSLTGTLSVMTPKTVSLSEAFSILAAGLDLKGFQFQKQDNFLVIKAKPKATIGRGGPGGFPSGLSGPGGQPGSRASSELRTYMLKFANAASVAKTINEAFAQSGSQSFGGFNFAGGGGNGPGVSFNGPPGGAGNGGGQGGGISGGGVPGAGFPGGGGFGAPGGGGTGGPGQANTSQGTVKASSDEYSNTVIVNASASLQVQVSDFIKKIDIDVKQPLITKLYPLTFASAQDVVSPIQTVLTANATKGKGATTAAQPQISFGPFATSSNQNTQGTVSAETRSNSLIVTTTEANQAIVEKLLQGIDKELVSIDANAVIPLANAKATDMATLLNQAFGTRSGSRISGTTTSGRTNTSSTSQRTNNSGGQAGSIGGQVLDTNNIYVQMRDPNAESGEILPMVTVQQGLPGFGQQSNQGSTTSTTSKTAISRDAQGRVVNTTDLTGRLTIVADSNTNSLLVVGDPDAVARLRTILDQLDKIPQQVVIETMIVEASLDSESKFGVEWTLNQPKAFGIAGSTGTVGTNLGVKPSVGSNQGFNYTLSGGNLAAVLNAFRTDQRFQVLSSPRIFTSNNVEATINISQSVPYITSQRTDTGGNTIYSYTSQDVGIVLTVTPQISPAGTVTLEVTQTANELKGYTSFNAPIVNKREATTTVSVNDGDTIVLGGIMQKTVSATINKVPLLGDIPFFGNLFRSTSKSDSKTELLVFLTPKIVRSPADAKTNADKQRKELGVDFQKKVGG